MSKQKILIGVIIVLCLFFPLTVICQSPFWGQAESELKFEHINTEQGLSSNVTTVILKDQQGFMWFGTEAGLNRYDGFEIKTFHYEQGVINTLSNDVIKALHQDSKGNLWIGTERGLNIYKPEDASIRNFYNETDTTGSLSNNIISCITEDKNSNIWIGTFWGLNLLTEWKNEQPIFKRFYADKNAQGNISNNRIYSVFSDSRDNLWLGTEGGGLNLLDAENKKKGKYDFQRICPVLNDSTTREMSVIYAITEDSKGNILIGSNLGFSIISYQNNVIDMKHYYVGTKGLDLQNIFSIDEDKNGQIWIGTFGGGLFLFDQKNEHFTKYEHDINNPLSISQNNIFSLSAQDDLLWLAIRERGIDRVNPQMQNFIHLRHKPNNENSLSNNIVKAIAEGPNGKFWFGTWGGGLNKYDPDKGLFQCYQHVAGDSSSLSSNIVESVCFDHIGRLWIGTSEGLNMFDKTTNSFVHYKNNSSDTNRVSNAAIWHVLPARDKSGIWIATYDGLDKYDWTDNKFYHFKNQLNNKNSLSYNFIRCLHEDTQENLWICTWGGGLNQLKLKEDLSPENCSFIHHQHDPEDKSSISSDLVNTIFEDSQGDLWVGTQSGLNHFDKKTGKFHAFFKNDGLPDNVIKGIQEDKNGMLWISTQNGLSRFNPVTRKFKNYHKKDGLQGNIFNLSSCLLNSRNELMFGGASGVSIFNPEDIEDTTNFPLTFFSDLRINAKSVLQHEELNKRLSNPLNQHPSLSLKHNENVLNFDFTAIEYLYPEKIKFAYRLDGVDTDWNYVPYTNRNVIYPGLKRGNYKFRVKASNSEGEWGDNEKSVRFRVMPHPARSNLAYLTYTLILIFIIYFIHKQVKLQLLTKQELAKEKEERKRQVELEQFKMQFFTNISHEFRTPITLLSGPLQKMMSGKNKLSSIQRENYLKVMHRSVSVLSKLVEQLLEFKKAENGKMKLRVSYADISKQLKQIGRVFQDFADQKNITFSYKPTQESMHYWYDSDKIEKILFNLLSNAFKFTPVGGAVTIHLKEKGEVDLPRIVKGYSKEDFYCLIVEDNGIGISNDNKEYIFDRFAQVDSEIPQASGTGIGLSFTKVMVELHHGLIDLESKINEGSKFYIWLPANERLFCDEEFIKDDSPNTILTNPTEPPLPFIPDISASGKEEQNLKREETILIIDDYSDLRAFLTEIFSAEFNVLQASNGREGLEKVHKFGPNLIITDVMMPEMDGIEFTKSLKKNLSYSHIPVIMLTAKNTIDCEIEGLETGADYYISKPFNVEQLQLIVNNVLENRKKVHQKYEGVRIPEPEDVTLVSADDKFMIKVGQVIETNISDPEFSVECLASDTGLSTVHLYRKLKALTGLTPNEFIRSFRMKRAAQLLMQQKLMISEVAYAVGFNDPKYFTKCFRKIYGTSPSDYINANSTMTET